MVLLQALVAAGFNNLVVCHLNHALRGRSSDADARLVVAEARRLGLAFQHARASTATYAQEQKKSLELAARELRLAFFEECARRMKTNVLVLAHHADDQVETCLFNFLRGSGAAGLGGMKPVSRLGNLTVHRPLLGVSRRDIEGFRKRHKVRFREDATNDGLEHTRNKLRHRVLPLLEEVMGGSCCSAILRAAEILRSEEEWMSSLMPPSCTELLCKDLQAMQPALRARVVLRWLRELGIPEAGHAETCRVLTLLDVANGPAKVNLPGNHFARRRTGVLFLEPGGL